MTIIMVWKEADVERVWLVSDSRISTQGEFGRKRYTDRGAKILEVPVILHSASPRPHPVRSATLGFAYAGSSLVALQSCAAVLPLWSRLRTSGPEVLPTVGEFACHLQQFVAAYSNDVASSGARADCECLLVGYDVQTASLDARLITTKPTDVGMRADVRQLQLSEPDALEVIGSGASDARERLDSARLLGLKWQRQPLAMIRHWLREDSADDIGGGVQLGIASSEGFELCFDVQPARVGDPVGSPLAAWKYRGFEFTDINHVGEAFVALRGLS